MYFGTDDEDLIPTQMQGDEIGTEQEESIPMQMESDEIVLGILQVHAISISGEDEDISVDTTNNINVINLSISKEVIPEVGKKFETEEAAYQFYNAYAYKVGFSVHKSNKHKDRSGKITDRVFCRSCQGKRGKDKRNVKSHRSETRFGCLARMKVKYCQDIGKYQVVEFVAEHNHTTCSPRKTHLCRSHRNFTAAQAAEADLAHSSVEILKHAASIYTPDVFESFQASLCKAHDSTLKLTGEFGTINTYEITPYQKHRHHLVKYDSLEGLVVCSCKKFEFVGILCSHALKVLSSKSLTSIPNRYILKRWTKNAKSGHIGASRSSTESISQEDPKAMMGRRYKELCRLSTQLATRSVETEKAYKITLDGFHKLLEEVDVILRRDEVEELLAKEQNESNNLDTASIGKRVRGIKVKERTRIKTSKRSRSALEGATKKKKTPGRPPLDDLDFMREPVTRSELPSSPHFLQLHTCTEALGMDASMVERPLNSLSQISQLAQPSQCAQGESPPERYGESQWDSWLTGDSIWSRHGEQDV
ncbi:hypothetical protein Vadar_018249 [Vaccinium darrowii]|uniref:Uncharacterized protein n=1 Tax=Vaccinium darrowii TaxID=229202 RepID=A0ACB7YX04_9ERIC|nr:hypothetical protein Vadar_018249 [Vaccinium darrowii]